MLREERGSAGQQARSVWAGWRDERGHRGWGRQEEAEVSSLVE